MHAGIPPPPSKADPPGKETPPWQGRPPLARQTPPSKADPPGKETPSCTMHAGRYGQQAGGMHPTGMQFLFLNFIQ